MKYTLQSSKYVFKNFIYLFPFAILPAVFFAVSTDKTAITDIVKALLSGNMSNWTFSRLFNAISVLNFSSLKSIVFGLTGVVLIVFCIALMMALLEKHMRIGKRTYNGLMGKLNDNFMSTLCVVLTVLAIYELWVLLLSAFLFLLSRITIVYVAYGLAILAFVAFHILLMTSVGAIYLWLPCPWSRKGKSFPYVRPWKRRRFFWRSLGNRAGCFLRKRFFFPTTKRNCSVRQAGISSV